MTRQRIILTVPFMRHYAGSVFELAPHFNGENDGYLEEKVSQTSKSGFLLPDGGRGLPVHLSQSDTIPCPEQLFDGITLDTGPCRVTALRRLMRPEAERLDGLDSLFDTPSGKGQGICIQLPEGLLKGEIAVVLTDVQEGRPLPCSYTRTANEIRFDCSGIGPGFYRIDMVPGEGAGLSAHWIKCFPLVAELDAGGRRVSGTIATIY